MQVVEEFVLDNSSVETIENWTQKKAKKMNKRAKPTRGKNTLENWKVKTADLSKCPLQVKTSS